MTTDMPTHRYGGRRAELRRQTPTDFRSLAAQFPSTRRLRRLAASALLVGGVVLAAPGVGAETETGTEDDDIIIGTPGPDVIAGLGGDDVIIGDEGDDSLSGGSGDDIVIGDDGDDVMDGGDGRDVLIGDEGDDSISAGAGDDIAVGGVGNDTLDGGDGNDIVVGDEGDDAISGGAGDDIVAGGVGHDTLDGGDGDDQVDGSDGDDTLDGGAGSDLVVGGDGDDTMSGGADDDLLTGENGDDSLSGGAGNDVVFGDQPFCGDAPDCAGADTLDGGDGEDMVHGGAGSDHAVGGTGNDLVIGDELAALLDGELFDVLFAVEEGGPGWPVFLGLDTLTDEQMVSLLEMIDEAGFQLPGGDDLVSGGPGADIVAGLGGHDEVCGDAEDVAVLGGAGSDVPCVAFTDTLDASDGPVSGSLATDLRDLGDEAFEVDETGAHNPYVFVVDLPSISSDGQFDTYRTALGTLTVDRTTGAFSFTPDDGVTGTEEIGYAVQRRVVDCPDYSGLPVQVGPDPACGLFGPQAVTDVGGVAFNLSAWEFFTIFIAADPVDPVDPPIDTPTPPVDTPIVPVDTPTAGPVLLRTPPAELPRTGSDDPADLALAGLALVAAGATASGLSRRLRRIG